MKLYLNRVYLTENVTENNKNTVFALPGTSGIIVFFDFENHRLLSLLRHLYMFALN